MRKAGDAVVIEKKLSRRFLGGALFLYLGLSLCVGWLFLLWHVRADREHTVQSARNQLTTTATAVAYSFAAMIHDGVGAAYAGANEIRARQGDASLSSEKRAAVLGRMLTGGPYVRELYVYYPNEFLSARRASNDRIDIHAGKPPPWLSVGDGERNATWVGRPMTFGDDAHVLVPVARKVELPGRGEWAGAVLSGETFLSLSASLDQEQGGVSLVAFDGTVLMRAPVDEHRWIGTNVSASEAFQQATATNAEVAFIDGLHPMTLRPRMIVSRRIPGYPIYATAGRDSEVLFGAWRERTAVAVQVAAASSLGLTTLTVALYVAMRRRWMSLEQARQRELRAHEQFSEQLIVAQEQERQRVANELHDCIGQNLSIIKNRATLALQAAEIPAEPSDHVRQLSSVATATIAELRAVVHDLLPVQVEQLGVTEALRTLTEEFAEACSVRMHTRIESVDDVLRGPEAMHVFRMVQEILSNINKHANASSCDVRIERDVRCVRIHIQDNGVGMAAAQKGARRGLGLASIRHRARILNAGLEIESEPGRGTRFSIRIPVSEYVSSRTAEATGGA